MEILNRLSSRKGDRGEDSNKIVAEQCLTQPRLLADICVGLDSKDKKLQSDCIEVFTLVSEKRPEFTVPYADNVLTLLSAKETKTRWEAVHTLSYIAEQIPDIIIPVLPVLGALIENDKSTIVRDYAIDAIANHAKTNAETSREAYRYLKDALALWGEKHARQVIRGFNNVLDKLPDYKAEINSLVTPFVSANKKIVATEAAKIVKRTQK